MPVSLANVEFRRNLDTNMVANMPGVCILATLWNFPLSTTLGSYIALIGIRRAQYSRGGGGEIAINDRLGIKLFIFQLSIAPSGFLSFALSGTMICLRHVASEEGSPKLIGYADEFIHPSRVGLVAPKRIDTRPAKGSIQFDVRSSSSRYLHARPTSETQTIVLPTKGEATAAESQEGLARAMVVHGDKVRWARAWALALVSGDHVSVPLW